MVDKHTLIIGGTSGVGRALAGLLVKDGCEVTITGRDEQKVEDIARDLGCSGAVCDVLEENSIESLIEYVSKDKPLDALAYCAGSIVIKPLKASSPEDFLEAYKLNTIGAARAIKAGTGELKKNKGSVVLFSTVAVSQGFPNHGVIASAKAGVEGLTRSLAAELAPDVRINCVAPSLLQTKMAEKFTGNEQMAKGIASLHPIPRLGEAEDAAHLARFLISEQSSWITGQIIGVDGGRSQLRAKG